MALLLLHLPTLALNATATLVYPLYASYKAVTSSSTSLADMEVWLIYWSVFACWTLLESVFGFLWSWVPFYYELRLLFNVWLVAPQTRGATYIYTNHLHPFLQTNQEQIDVWIEDAKRAVRAKVDASLGGLWSASLGGSATENAAPAVPVSGKDARHRPPAGNAPAPPTQHNPAQAPLSMFGNLVKTYAPVAIASARNFLETKAPAPNVAAYSIPATGGSREDAMHRRRQLESQLAALDASGVPSSSSSSSNSSGEDDAHVPVTVMANPGPRARRASGAGTLRNRVVSGKSTVKAGAAMGESYDLLDQNDLAPLQGSPARDGKRNWMPWSPKEL
ncbi:hypothetical protein EX895_002201 [Sporisorium graminicola]|uniref:Protein YOP1 n=1 Tax=Sporisorium graminicola TaxID=280036 RepID=A0A4U7KWT1_9BASI|nr:hypothetical protein EX895_002201 [Sporisorium graminicola]TKY88960.1 hypothetical protein EX895_002201 [Sporisorium graminicola]